MLSIQENKLLTQVGPGTPGGELMRRYWHPIAAVSELAASPFRTKEIRIMGEDLVLFRDRSGKLGLIDRWCAHRRVNLAYGVVEEDGLRCQYHGWKYDTQGHCVEQPFEETVHPEGSFKQKCSLTSYHVEELSGLIFAYIGPEPAPLLPNWEPLIQGNAVKDIAITELPANWLQCQENSLDPVHAEWLHGYFGKYLAELAVDPNIPGRENALSGRFGHVKIGFDVFEHGIIKRRMLRNSTEEDDDWKNGHPILFPNILLVGSQWSWTFQWRVPIDDEHTFHVSLYTWPAAPGTTSPPQDEIPYRVTPLLDEQGRYIVSYTFNQDYMAWINQGPTKIAERNYEKLGESDKGVILFRKLLKEQMKVVEEGNDPMNTFRDPEKNVSIELPKERVTTGGSPPKKYIQGEAGYSQDAEQIQEVMQSWVTPETSKT